MAIGCWDAEMHGGLTPTAWCRSLLHVAIQQREDAARRVADLLDLRHLEEVMDVRASLPSELACRAANAAVAAGETWHFQGWFRDADPTATSNFTDAVAITFVQ